MFRGFGSLLMIIDYLTIHRSLSGPTTATAPVTVATSSKLFTLFTVASPPPAPVGPEDVAEDTNNAEA